MSCSDHFFSGWVGFGSALNSSSLVEPIDIAYVRRPISYAPLDGTTAQDISAGSIGPATISWTGLSLAGLFDAQSGGNLLAAIPLTPPFDVMVGGTLTTSQRFGFRLSAAGDISSLTAMTWLAGSELGRTRLGYAVTACSNLQLSGGVLSTFPGPPSSLSLTSLPLVQPAAGSGQLWNNGGVICIA